MTTLAAAGDKTALKRASLTNSNIVYHEERGLVQRLGCKGGVVAQARVASARFVVAHEGIAPMDWLAPAAPGL